MEATSAMIVSRLKDGGQSIKIYSYDALESCIRAINSSFNLKALLLSPAVSTSKPDKSTFEDIKLRFSNFVGCITLIIFLFPFKTL